MSKTSEWMDWTPLTIMTTRAPAVLKRCKSAQHWTPDRNANNAVSKYDGHDRRGICHKWHM